MEVVLAGEDVGDGTEPAEDVRFVRLCVSPSGPWLCAGRGSKLTTRRLDDLPE